LPLQLRSNQTGFEMTALYPTRPNTSFPPLHRHHWRKLVSRPVHLKANPGVSVLEQAPLRLAVPAACSETTSLAAAAQPTIEQQPGECSCDDPPPWEHMGPRFRQGVGQGNLVLRKARWKPNSA